MESNSTLQLLDSLIEHWRFWDSYEEFYLTQLAPSLVADSSKGDDIERDILDKLKELLSDSEWKDLPNLIAKRRQGILKEIESERARRLAEAQESARQEALLKQLERIRQQEEAEKKARREEWLKKLRDFFSTDYLAAEAFYQDTCAQFITRDDFQRERTTFIRSWLLKNTGIKQENIPDDEQLAAVATLNKRVQVTARAGSGKTTTLVYRAFFLIKHCGVSPNEMLLLAFNKKAALEIRRKLLALFDPEAELSISRAIESRKRNRTGSRQRNQHSEIEDKAVEYFAAERNICLPHVMTFHALAYAIVHPEEPILSDDPEDGSLALSRTLQFVVDDHLQVPEYKEKIRELMLAHFREDWDRIVEGCYDQSQEELLSFRRSLPRESLGGDYLKSYGEKVIADFLFEHGIEYKYERNHWWDDVNYRPDFTIFSTPERGVIIEYFGLAGDEDYDEMSEAKRQYWSEKQDWSLIEFSPRDITEGGLERFRQRLRRELEANGICCEPLSEDEIWHRIRVRTIDRFTRTMVGFIKRCRKRSLTPPSLRALIDSYRPLSTVEERFLELSHLFYSAYLSRLAATGEDDFDGLMQRAAASIESGSVLFKRKSEGGDLSKLRHIFIDEFQDFSDLFYRLLSAIFKFNRSVDLFCVGDDWQAINGFAGSDLRFFENFEEYVGAARHLTISTNYRSRSAIVAIGNALMEGFGVKALAHKPEPGRVLLCDLQEFRPSLLEKQRHPGDDITPAVLRVVNRALADGSDVVLLCRRNGLPWFVSYEGSGINWAPGLDRYLELLRSYFPERIRKRITISTAHKYKGLQKPWVIVLDAVDRSYPLIHPDWIFSRILGDSLETISREERRLFYVALTRASDSLVIFTEQRSKSPFLEDLERKQVVSRISWDKFPPKRGDSTRLVVKIGNQDGRGVAPTFAIKDYLKAAGYQWQNRGWPAWAKSFPAEGFAVNALESEIWASEADGVEVRILDESDSEIARYSIDDGNWDCRFEAQA